MKPPVLPLFEVPVTVRLDRLVLGSPLEVHREDKRRMSNKLRVLARLQQGPATTRELMEIGGCRAPARCFELKREGYPIEVEDLGAGLFRYSLKESA